MSPKSKVGAMTEDAMLLTNLLAMKRIFPSARGYKDEEYT